MRLTFALLVAAALLFTASTSFADGRAFPPDDCTSSSPFMFYNGDNNSNTKCKTGQDIIKSAIPTCTAGQIVAFDGANYLCKTQTQVPACQPGTFLTFDGQQYSCSSTGVATCGTDQVLTFNGTSYYCVNKDASIPVCGPNQFLTYNGAYQCANVSSPSIPDCPPGYYVTGNGSTLYCVARTTASADLDAEYVKKNCPPGTWDAGDATHRVCYADCPAGKNILAGGCFVGGWQSPSTSMPETSRMWHCSTTSTGVDITIMLVCGNFAVRNSP